MYAERRSRNHVLERMTRDDRGDHLRGNNLPAPIEDGDAPDLRFILDTVYRSRKAGAAADEVAADSAPPMSATFNGALPIAEPSPWKGQVQGPRRSRASPRRRRRNRRTERDVVYALMIATLAALVFGLLLIRAALA